LEDKLEEVPELKIEPLDNENIPEEFADDQKADEIPDENSIPK